MNIRAITFDQIKKLDAQGNFDLSATLGEFVKVTYNEHPSETLQGNGKIKIRGKLRVDLWLNGKSQDNSIQVSIASDNEFDRIALQWLNPWLGEVRPSKISVNATVLADLPKFERQFILPFMAELTAHLSGQNPLEHLTLKGAAFYLQRNGSNHPFDEKIAPSLDEKKGDVQLTLRDGTKVVGMDLILRSALGRGRLPDCFVSVIASLATLEKCRKSDLEARLHEGSVMKATMADAEKTLKLPTEKKHDESVTSQEKNFHSLYLLVAAYRMKRKIEQDPVCFFEPFRKEMLHHLINVLLPAVTAEGLIELRSAPGRAFSFGFDMYKGPTHLHNLIALGDSDVLQAVLDELKKKNLDINQLCQFSSPFLHFIVDDDLSVIERRRLLKQLFDAGMKLTSEELDKMIVELDPDISTFLHKQIKKEIQQPLKQTAFAPIPVEEEQQPIVEFKSAAIFFDTENNRLNVAATIGNIIKLTLNESKEHPPICGTLTVTHESGGSRILIESDNKEDRLERLIQKWGGAFGSSEGQFALIEIRWLDRYFIFPYLAEFKHHLAGQNPLENFLLTDLSHYLKVHRSIKLAEEKPCYLDEKSGELIIRFGNGDVFQGHLQVIQKLGYRENDRICAFSIFPEYKVFSYVLEPSGIEELFVSIQLQREERIKECHDEKAYQIQFLKWILANFQFNHAPFSKIRSIWEDVRKSIVHQVVSELLPTLKMEDLSQDMVCTGLNFPDRTIFKAFLYKLREANIDLNNYFADAENPLIWFSLQRDFQVKTFRREERQWIVQRLFEEGLSISSEMYLKLRPDCFRDTTIELILSEFFLHYKRMVDFILIHLKADPASVVMRYLVCDAFVNKVVKVLPTTVERASQNRNSFLTTMTEAGSPGESPEAAVMSPRVLRHCH